MNEGAEIFREVLNQPTVFKNEEPLSIDYVPSRLPHRDEKLRFLAHLFRFIVERPGSMNQRVLITGNIGTGKTVVSQRFGMDLMKMGRSHRVNLHYVHVNCRELRGSLFLILKRVVSNFIPNFPQRGYSSEELLQMLMQVLDSHNAFVLLALDELESLIRTEGTSALYNLTRLQEGRLNKPMRLSLICILRDTKYLNELDRSTLGTLQQNIIEMEDYSEDQLASILTNRVEMSFKEGAVPLESIHFIAELTSSAGDARYAIELLWRAGKHADSEHVREVTPEHVRKAMGGVYPTLRSDSLTALAQQERYVLLATARALEASGSPYVTMGEIENLYKVVCEELGEVPRAHTQVWKYIRELAASGTVEAMKSGKGMRGRTTLVGMSFAPASTVRRWLEASIGAPRNA